MIEFVLPCCGRCAERDFDQYAQAAPPQVKLPGVAAVAMFRALRSRAKLKRAASAAAQAGAGRGDGGVALRWNNISMRLAPKKKSKKKKGAAADVDAPKRILDDVSGAAKPGRLLAIMGPSGSGKTSLLNTIACQVPANKRMTLRGELTANGAQVGRSGGGAAAHRTAYVQQEDVFYSQLTVGETLSMAARMRMPGDATPKERDEAVSELLNRLGLAHVRGARVGDKKTRGISGGEKKRLSLACELIGGRGSSPSVVCADEPTSGLDAFQAQRVMESLRSLAADENRTVVCSIHQPRGSIVALFDDICLLAGGRVVYAVWIGGGEDTTTQRTESNNVCILHYILYQSMPVWGLPLPLSMYILSESSPAPHLS